MIFGENTNLLMNPMSGPNYRVLLPAANDMVVIQLEAEPVPTVEVAVKAEFTSLRLARKLQIWICTCLKVDLLLSSSISRVANIRFNPKCIVGLCSLIPLMFGYQLPTYHCYRTGLRVVPIVGFSLQSLIWLFMAIMLYIKERQM